jgi:hypothetical protein
MAQHDAPHERTSIGLGQAVEREFKQGQKASCFGIQRSGHKQSIFYHIQHKRQWAPYCGLKR